MQNVKFNSKASTTAPNTKQDILGTAIEITVAVVCCSLIARALRPAPVTPVYYVVQGGGTSTTQQQS